MAYTDESVLAKLSALNETQEGIVTVAQWIMFHRRHAERTSQLWMQKLKDSTASKKLNLIYLVNEVVQQSKARRKNDFVAAFSPVMVEASSAAYRGATQDIQQKLRRVIEVWRHRNIFDPATQSAIENAINELDKARGSGRRPGLGGSLFSGSSASAPPELEKLASLQSSLSKAEQTAKPAAKSASEEYTNYSDPSRLKPSPPVQAAQLSTLLKCLARAEGAVTESIKARRSLIEELQTLLDNNKGVLKEEEKNNEQAKSRYAEIETKKKEVEDAIMRGLSEEGRANEQSQSHQEAHNDVIASNLEPERPHVEELTPPPPETAGDTPSISDGQINWQEESKQEPSQNIESRDADGEGNTSLNIPFADPRTAPQVADLLSSLANPPTLPQGDDETSNGLANATGGPTKRRKLMNGGVDDFSVLATGDAMDEIDDDVAAMLTKD